MAKLVARRVAIIAAVVLAGGAVAAGVAVAADGGHDGPASSPGGGSRVATEPVVRTNLITTVQVGGSIGYDGSYAIAAPSGASPSQVSQARQAVTQDRQAVSADQQADSDAAAADNQAISADQANVSTDKSALTAERAKKTRDCAGPGASTAACSQDDEQVTQDQATLTQARQQLAAARSAAKLDHDQDQAKVASDQATLQGGQAALASLQPTAANPGTTYTWLPAVGEVIRQERPLYAVSNEPVPLLYGSIPAYRAFYAGMSDGADVGELTRDLIALGYGAGLARSDHYSPATAAAVQRWQKARGLHTSQRADNVLAVPVNALLALAGGGYGVDVVTDSTIRLVGVTTGLYSATLVQVSGSGITAGTQVEVPSS